MIGVYLHIGVSMVALVIAFVAQRVLPPRRRTRIIFVSAAIPAVHPVLAALIIPLVVQIRLDTDLSWFQQSMNLLFAFMTMMFVGLVGAILGTELASLMRWLMRRRG
ncbi:hypothetical protein [Sphingosinicella terrae]|uniref:hypothetical protein n=1 Tax=Sphingosinicella terrae TaxID=2172047 RepID=UPI000E0D0FD0|nr:hypothetical protein [Sphingosinicella terrae]